jgi:hypothetical protein
MNKVKSKVSKHSVQEYQILQKFNGSNKILVFFKNYRLFFGYLLYISLYILCLLTLLL